MLTDTEKPFADILTLSEVARILRCSKAHICKVVRGEIAGLEPIPVVALGRRRLVRKQSFFAWLERTEQVFGDATMRPSERGARRRA